jgi:sugar O-acyltransferase (sialic acid O-acetyltransferase NeuD family)
MASAELVLIGGGGHALVVLEAARAAGLSVRGFFDDDDACPLASLAERLGGIGAITHSDETERLGAPGALGSMSDLPAPAILALGGLASRRHMIERLASAAWERVVHPSAIVSPTASIGEGVYIGAGAVVNARATVGDHAIINTGAIVEHDCELGENAHVAPRTVLGGGAAVGRDTLIGIGATVLPRVRIGAHCVLAAGGAAVHDIPDKTTAVGSPARAVGRGSR